MEWLWPSDWSTTFIPDKAILEVILRGSIVYLGIIVLMRIVLRRQAGEMELSDILLITLIADAAQNGMADEYKSLPIGLLLVATLIGWNYLLDTAEHRWHWARRFLSPSPVPIIRNGKVLRRNLDRERLTEEALLSQLRLNGLERPEQVRSAFVESDGKVSVVPFESEWIGAPAAIANNDGDVNARIESLLHWHERQMAFHRRETQALRRLLPGRTRARRAKRNKKPRNNE